MNDELTEEQKIFQRVKLFLLHSTDNETIKNIALELLDSSSYEEIYNNWKEKIHKEITYPN